MNLIYKQELEITDEQVLVLPFNSKILKAAEQNGKLCIWYIFDEYNTEITEIYKFFIYGTGNNIDTYDVRTRAHIDSVLMNNGFVWHVFLAI